MGEQVAGKAGYGWFDGVRADLEETNYAGRAVDIPALAVNAPHIRQRLYWAAIDLANASNQRRERNTGKLVEPQPLHEREKPVAGGSSQETFDSRSGSSSHMANADKGGRGRRPRDGDGERDGQAPERDEDHRQLAGGGEDRLDVADAEGLGPQEREWAHGRQDAGGGAQGRLDPAGAGSFWSDAVWLTGSDGKSRRVEPSISLLAHGIPNRVGRLRAYGNAIVPPLAAEVIKAFMECEK
jgi:DNA (cytosine-5)-methyltransferase 1